MGLSGKEYLNSLLNEICKFENRLYELSNKAYPAKFFEELIKVDLIPIVEEFKTIIIKEISLIEKRTNYTISNEAVTVITLWSYKKLQNIAKAINNTDFKSHPLEIMNVFRDIIKEINNEDFEILTIPTEIMNFSFQEIWLELKRFIEDNLNVIKLNVNKKLIRLSFPEEHKDNLLLSGIFFHEVGHYLERKNKIADKIYTQLDYNSTEFMNLNRYILNEATRNPINQINLINIMNKCYLHSWIREIISDSIAIYMLGPAFIFSMMEFIITLRGPNLLFNGTLIDSVSYTHPGFKIRFEYLLEVVQDLDLESNMPEKIYKKLEDYKVGWDNAAIKLEDNFRYIMGAQSATYVIHENNRFFTDLEKVARQAFSMVMEETKKLLNKKIINKSILNTANKLAEERYKMILPPNELDNQAVDSIAILNSAWYAKILYKEEMIKSIGNIDELNGEFDINILINDFIKYALRTSRIQRRWQA
ncbi:MAG: hypothetical protein ACOCRO_05140 [Halanaerobiales bacterium]